MDGIVVSGFTVSGTHPKSGFYGVKCDTWESAQAKAVVFRLLGFGNVTVDNPAEPSAIPAERVGRE